jgi:hypothetical protein
MFHAVVYGFAVIGVIATAAAIYGVVSLFKQKTWL